MSDDREKSGTGDFLSRWSRLKREAREISGAAEAPAPPPAANDAGSQPPALPPVESLTIDSDFSGFFHPQVDPGVRRAALKKLFSEPHFNVMDGLDVYVDDYSQPNPLPATMLAGLRQARSILEWARETREEAAARVAAGMEYGSAPSPAAITSMAEEQAPPAAAGQAAEPDHVASPPPESGREP